MKLWINPRDQLKKNRSFVSRIARKGRWIHGLCWKYEIFERSSLWSHSLKQEATTWIHSNVGRELKSSQEPNSWVKSELFSKDQMIVSNGLRREWEAGLKL